MVLWNMLFDVFTYFSQGVGVTATLPDEVPHYLPGGDSGPQEWYYGGTVLWHNGRSCVQIFLISGISALIKVLVFFSLLVVIFMSSSMDAM